MENAALPRLSGRNTDGSGFLLRKEPGRKIGVLASEHGCPRLLHHARIKPQVMYAEKAVAQNFTADVEMA
jgi:hypothetical protein